MKRLFVAIWFPYLKTDWLIKKNPALKNCAFVTSTKQKNRLNVMAANATAQKAGIYIGMAVADARAICTGLEVLEDEAGLDNKLLLAMAQYCIRFTPVASVDGNESLLLDVSGCTHLWGGAANYIETIQRRFEALGYSLYTGLAPTIGAAWALARFSKKKIVINEHEIRDRLKPLPTAALRIDASIVQRLHMSGIATSGQLFDMPATALRRRFGSMITTRIEQAIGNEPEWITGVDLEEEYLERLPCIEPVFTATALEIAIRQLLEQLCTRLQKQQKGIRHAILKCYRVDNRVIEISIGTGCPSTNVTHLLKLFQIKIETIAPGFGIELFTLTATKVQESISMQNALWNQPKGIMDSGLSELIDRIRMKVSGIHISRFIPQQHYWPERSYTSTNELNIGPTLQWEPTGPRPLHLLKHPEMIAVTAPIPDYPPMSFRYKGNLHKIVKADGPERIEPEWWISEGQHRDYYYVEDEVGKRYWLFRSGHYDAGRNYEWYLHGFFA